MRGGGGGELWRSDTALQRVVRNGEGEQGAVVWSGNKE